MSHLVLDNKTQWNSMQKNVAGKILEEEGAGENGHVHVV